MSIPVNEEFLRDCTKSPERSGYCWGLIQVDLRIFQKLTAEVTQGMVMHTVQEVTALLSMAASAVEKAIQEWSNVGDPDLSLAAYVTDAIIIVEGIMDYHLDPDKVRHLLGDLYMLWLRRRPSEAVAEEKPVEEPIDEETPESMTTKSSDVACAWQTVYGRKTQLLPLDEAKEMLVESVLAAVSKKMKAEQCAEILTRAAHEAGATIVGVTDSNSETWEVRYNYELIASVRLTKDNSVSLNLER